MGMFWKRNHSQIHVEYFDADTRAKIGQVMMPIEKLPRSFEADTTLHRGDRDYSVVEARPLTAEEFARTGKLRLVIREVKITQADPREILFSLPTIDESIGAIEEGSTKLPKRVLELHEDHWRQSEFVSLSHQTEIDRHFGEIRRIHEEERAEIGFRKIHVREGFPPLATSDLTLDEIVHAAGSGATVLDGVGYHGIAGTVRDGFAVSLLCGIHLYGVAPGGRVAVLCLDGAPTNNAPFDSAATSLAELARKNALCVIDWCRAQQVFPEVAGFMEYFASLR